MVIRVKVRSWSLVLTVQQVQVKKEYYGPYKAAIVPILVKPLEVEFYSRLPGNEWVNVREGVYPDRS